MSALVSLCRRIAASPWFQNAIMAVIVANAVLLGIETSSALMARYGATLSFLNALIQTIFVVEIAVRLAAHAPRVHRFFGDGWNVFDFLVVGLSLLPQAGAFATIARVARLMRVSRLVSVWPELRLIIGTMLKSIPSMGHVIALLSLLLYIYGIMGFHLFRGAAPEYWGSLRRSVESLFQILTLEGWVEIAQRSQFAHPLGWLFFTSFIVVAVFVVTNLFIAVVINNLDRVRAEQVHMADEASVHHELIGRIETVKRELSALEARLRALSERDAGRRSPPEAGRPSAGAEG